MKTLEELLNESIKTSFDNNGRPEFSKMCELTLDQVQMLIMILDENKLSKAEFNKIFKNGYGYSEYEDLISQLKDFKKKF